jgi:hypothetical protein
VGRVISRLPAHLRQANRRESATSQLITHRSSFSRPQVLGPWNTRARPLPLSRRCHNRAKLIDTSAYLHGCFCAGQQPPQTAWNRREHPESTSQAEYAGSIPVIGSTFYPDIRLVHFSALGGRFRNSPALRSATRLRLSAFPQCSLGAVLVDHLINSRVRSSCATRGRVAAFTSKR